MVDRFAGVELTHAGPVARLRVQALSSASAQTKPIPVLGHRVLPHPVGSTAEDLARALCVGPTDWLVFSSRVDSRALHEGIGVDASAFAIVDVSDALATIAIEGSASGILLAKGCGLDLRSSGISVGRCARTRLAELPVVIDRVAQERFELHIGRSFREYLSDWLVDAALGLAPGEPDIEGAPGACAV